MIQKQFINQYYKDLCLSYNNIEHFYTTSSTIKINYEGDETLSFKLNKLVDTLFLIHSKKKVIKVFVNTVNNVDNLINVVGQFVYHDNRVQRFVQCFLLENNLFENNLLENNLFDNNLENNLDVKDDRIPLNNFKFIIKYDILTMLDEEVIFKNIICKDKISNKFNSIRIKRNNNLKSNKIITDIMQYGNILAIEKNDNDLLVEFENEESCRKIRGIKGYKIEYL